MRVVAGMEWVREGDIDRLRRIGGWFFLGMGVGMMNRLLTFGECRGQYSDAVLNELESQNDDQVGGILGKVRQLKGVCSTTALHSPNANDTQMTIAIGEEIRESSALAEKMNDGFDNTRVRLRGTMNRMLIMAEKTGVGWKVWLAFFAAVGFLFFYVWVF